ncbi:MAG: IS1634 family transposase [Deltaproteobacteria bacterium]|nr:IS1634 family transposase [Deltaproteobacteria bacterium]
MGGATGEAVGGATAEAVGGATAEAVGGATAEAGVGATAETVAGGMADTESKPNSQDTWLKSMFQMIFDKFATLEKRIVGFENSRQPKHEDNEPSCASNSPKRIEMGAVQGPHVTTHKFFGATYLLDQIGNKLGLIDDLKQCFPENWNKLLSIAYFFILDDNSPLYMFEQWDKITKHPFNSNISSQRSSEIFSSITDEERYKFFRLQGDRRIETEYWAYDITTISSYSKKLEQVQYGKNKENDRLPQLNLALLFGEDSGLPFYYRKLAGAIPDVKTIRILLHELNAFGFSNVKLAMDRGFYSAKNISDLFREDLKFLVGVKKSTNFAKDAIESALPQMWKYSLYNSNMNLYGVTVPGQWDYKEIEGNKESPSIQQPISMHVFYNNQMDIDETNHFFKQIDQLSNELISGKRKEMNEKSYGKYFKITMGHDSTIDITPNDEQIFETRKDYGFVILLTNEKMDAFTAMKLYRAKDVAEKAFGHLKERLNMRRMLVSSELSLEGKLFVQFIALILVSYINKKMHDNNIYRKYTMAKLLKKLNLIECFEKPGFKMQLGEILKEQKEIYISLGIDPPESS